MAVRQYVGARYVPKFAEPTEWNKGYAYEALTIVTHNGNSYTSKKAVPVGIELTNTEYWASTGIYNQQVETYRQEVEGVKNAQASADAVIGTHTSEIKDVQSDITSINKTLAIGNLKKVNAILIGDSYTRGTGGTVGRGLGYYLNSYFKTLKVYATGGAGYINPGNTGSGDFGGKNFVQEIDAVANGMSDLEKQDVQLVMCLGGTNDTQGNSGDNILNAVVSFCTKAKQNFPNAVVACIPLWCDAVMNKARYTGLQAVAMGAYRSGALTTEYAKWWFLGWSTMGAGDNIHLNETGYQRMSNYIASVLVGWNGVAGTQIDQGDSNVSAISRDNYKVTKVGDHAMFNMSLPAQTQFLSGDDPLNFITLDARVRPGTTIYVPGFAWQNTTTVQIVMFQITASGGVCLAPYYARQLTGSWELYMSATYLVGVTNS